jgi:tripartite-type tricarboxylate transporter receptor subunit TctC
MCDFGRHARRKVPPGRLENGLGFEMMGFLPQENQTMFCLSRFVLAAVLALLTTAVLGQDYPNKPIRIVVAFPPGGATDVIARVVGQPLGARLGQQVIVDNRPGSNGNIAAELSAKARPDGYTLMLGSDSLFGINPHLYAKMPVDLNKDFVPITNLVSNQIILAVHPTNVPANDIKGFIDFAKRAKPALFYASIGNGSQHHLAMEMLKRRAGFEATHVPYKGGGPAAIAVMSGEVAAMFGGGSVLPLAKSGKLKPLAVSSKKRSTMLPDLPSISEIYPDYEVTIWQGLFAPAGTPKEIIEKIRTEVNVVLAMPDVAEKLLNTGSGEPNITTPQEFAAMIRRDYENYGKIIRETGVKVDD